ncbi:MAG: exodeoxyribonuclease VII large subunit [Agathobacter sp.]|nr:exodeoxyribonuclease VII large subunit [Agathobacter sp.]
MKTNVYTVGWVNQYIKNMFAQDYLLHRIMVKGEVSNCKYHSSGHIYFTLKDDKGAMSAVMFAGNRRGLQFAMKDGDKVVVTGSVEVYERDGKYQIYAREIALDGEGDLYLRFEALKKELQEMGMFDAMYKKPIPKYAKRVGVVTARTGAAIQDIRNISARRNPYVQMILYPAQVQGEGAALSIVNGIRALEQMGVDTIIVGRGGGSIEDLWAFNEEIVARAIFDCSVPIISAVGHETDWTIADFVADMRAPTPSAAAELAVYELSLVTDTLEEYKIRLQKGLDRQVRHQRQRLANYETKLYYLSPQTKLNERRHQLVMAEERLKAQMNRIFQNKKQVFALLMAKLEGQSPMKKLQSGYAYVADATGKRITRVAEVQKGQELEISMQDGSVLAKVSDVQSGRQ